ncbi:iron-sulfur cluster repair di-iron protein [Flavicella sp.]|uniref:iron-sulfur cluster repair di-iron protein n=1 Tax=Flavicella sp. TaxID=2957742 RepID=UPI00263747A7|nr:iron-sulfur cluster repair di-iron protein [Flavicella sp.]MDG1805021.1 iron-sulfur cluster repair di-iron protein [Flavicella sp.]MDG2279917.1 iron-sulfur cluster repair di-iron protein [Flavicella sp.]
MLTITKECTVADVVSNNIKTADIFKKHGIDFCCGGGVSLDKICDKKGVSYNVLSEELKNVDVVTKRAENYDTWNLNFLMDHIVNIHHKYVLDSVDILNQYINKVAKVHGHHYTELLEIQSLFREVAQELNFHMQKEEKILFPYIKYLVQIENGMEEYTKPHFQSVQNPIQVMEEEHESAGDIFKRIAELTNNYTPPKEACNTFKAMYSKLQEFEEDLHQHIHLENNILHPKAKKIEKMILSEL